MTEYDYDEALRAEFDIETHLEVFGCNSTIPIEVSTCEYHDKDHNDVRKEGNTKMDFHSHFQMVLLRMKILHMNT